MSKNKDYNSRLRSTILIRSIRCEEASSNVIRAILGNVKEDSKALGNKSSSLSFKNKIDILYDLGDLSSKEYSDALKFMEIRNQFTHNPNCNHFTDLKKESPDVPKYLKKNYPTENASSSEEEQLNEAFGKIFKLTLGRLLVLNFEYSKGYSVSLKRYVNDKIVESIDEIIEKAKERSKEQPKGKQLSCNPIFGMGPNLELELENFSRSIRYVMATKGIEIIDKLEKDDELGKVMIKKVTVEELLKKMRAEKEKNKTMHNRVDGPATNR